VEVFDKKLTLASVEDTIQVLLNPDIAKQKFKSTVSMVFAVLVGAVIMGFFGLPSTMSASGRRSSRAKPGCSL
jgi:hypothetical protein